MENIDSTPFSLCIGTSIGIIAGYFLKKYLETIPDADPNMTWFWSIVFGIFITIVALVGYKQFMIYRGTRNIMTKGYYD